MNHENGVKVGWSLPDRHMHLTFIPCNKYSWSICYSFSKMETNIQKLGAMNCENEIKVK